MSISHIGFIMDGNRRYAKKNKLEVSLGHNRGAEVFEQVCRWVKEANITESTFYVFSTENFKRSKAEIEGLKKILHTYLVKMKSLLESDLEDTCVHFIGEFSRFGEEISSLIEEIMNETKQRTKYTLNLALCYGGRTEIVQAVKVIAQEFSSGKCSLDDIDEQFVSSHLSLQSDPELVIRTGGDIRTSNFFPWQTVYSEWYFTDVLWPEFSKEEMLSAITEFSSRQRRFGA